MKVLFKIFCIFFFLSTLSIALPLNKDNFLVISDIHLDKQATHPMEISPFKGNQNNDLDWVTFQKLLAAVSDGIKKGTIAKPQFIIYLGDLVGHIRIDSTSAPESETLVFSALKNTFSKIPLLYVFGNNDSLIINYGPFNDSHNSPYDIAKNNADWKNGFLSTGVECSGQKNIFPCIISENKMNGFYSAYLKPKLRLISLNTILFSPKRKLISEKDSLDQLNWLNNQLEMAEKNRESVLIAMHIPPGNNVYDHSDFWLPKEKHIFLKLINQYQNIIMGLLSSHTHAEEIKIIKDPSGKIISAVYYTSALSTSHGNEPSVKTFFYSKNHGKWLLTNYETFYANENDSKITFNKLYDYQAYYCDKPHVKLSDCLDNITADKMKKYFSAGNPHFMGTMKSPRDFILIQ